MPPRQELFENDISGDLEHNALIAVCDPYSTGCLVVKEMQKRGHGAIAIWSKECSEELKQHVPKAAGKMNYIAEIQEADSLDETIQRVKRACCGIPLAALIPGGEGGVDLSDKLSEAMGLPGNGTGIPNRRDKKVQQDLIRKRGLRAIKEACGSKISEIEEFLKQETYPLVLKPLDSAGSDGVKTVYSFEEAKEHFESLINKPMVNGPICEAILCQERLVGNEYVVDNVSCNGNHKLMMLWVYDKRPANGADFVYYAAKPVDPQSPEAKLLVPYMQGVLDAIGVKYGATHGEVIITEGGPCLVEVNCRTNGGDGNWIPLARALTGGADSCARYSQVDATADCYLDEEKFHCLPDLPPSPLKDSGEEVMLVSYDEGKVKATPGFDEIQQMNSFVQLETGAGIGSQVEKSVDLITGLGSVILMNDDKVDFERDLSRIRELETSNQMLVLEDG